MGYSESRKGDIIKILYSNLERKIMDKNCYVISCNNNGGPHRDVIERFDGEILKIQSDIRWMENLAA
jgi:hypothetical protein